MELFISGSSHCVIALIIQVVLYKLTLLIAMRGLLIVVASLVVENRLALGHGGFSSCRMEAE